MPMWNNGVSLESLWVKQSTTSWDWFDIQYMHTPSAHIARYRKCLLHIFLKWKTKVTPTEFFSRASRWSRPGVCPGWGRAVNGNLLEGTPSLGVVRWVRRRASWRLHLLIDLGLWPWLFCLSSPSRLIYPEFFTCLWDTIDLMTRLAKLYSKCWL